MGKKILVIVLLVCLTCPLFATLDMSKAEDYQTDEFPKWALDIRRTEVIFFGALPFSFVATSAITSLAGSDMSFFPTLGISALIATGITVADIIIGLNK